MRATRCAAALLTAAAFFVPQPLWAQAKKKDGGGNNSARERQLQNEIDQLKKRLADVSKDNAEGSKQLAEANRRIADLMKRGAALENQAERALRQAQEEIKRLQRELDEAKRSKGSDEVRRLERQLDAARAEAAELLRQSRLGAKAFGELQGENRELRKQIGDTKRLQDDLLKVSKDLAAIETDRGRFQAALAKALDSSDVGVRQWGIECLAELGLQARFAVPALEKLRDTDSEAKVREAAIAALAKIRAAKN
jgi:chromosome segregation ATPase